VSSACGLMSEMCAFVELCTGIASSMCGRVASEMYIWLVTMTDSTKNATPPKSTRSRISYSAVQIQIKPQFQFQFVPRDTEKSEFLDLVDLGDVAFSV